MRFQIGQTLRIQFEISDRTDSTDSVLNRDKVATFLPSLDQADHDKESTLIKIPPASFIAQLKNEKDSSYSKSKDKLKTRGRGRSRGGRGRKLHQFDPKQPKIDAFWKRNDSEDGGGQQ